MDFNDNEKQFSQIDLAIAWESTFLQVGNYTLEPSLEVEQPRRARARFFYFFLLVFFTREGN